MTLNLIGDKVDAHFKGCGHSSLFLF